MELYKLLTKFELIINFYFILKTSFYKPLTVHTKN